jgi:hypothetical protein
MRAVQWPVWMPRCTELLKGQHIYEQNVRHFELTAANSGVPQHW